MRLWIDFCRPFFGLFAFLGLLHWSTHYYPPPPILPIILKFVPILYRIFQVQLNFAWDIFPLFLLLCGLHWFFPHLPFLRTASPSVHCPSVRLYVDCSLPLPASLLVFSAIHIQPAFTYLFGLQRWRPRFLHFSATPIFQFLLLFCFWLWIFFESLLVSITTPPSYLLYDGVRRFQVTPRSYLYRLRSLRGRMHATFCDFAFHLTCF